MDTSRLLTAISEVINAYEHAQIVSKLNGLHATAANYYGSPSNAAYFESFKAALDDFQTGVRALQGRRFSEAARMTLASVGSDILLPDELVTAVRSSIDRTVSSIQWNGDVVGKVVQEIVAKHSALMNARDSLLALGVKPMIRVPGMIEIGVYIPTAVTQDDLDGIQSQLSDWQTVIRTAMELGTSKVSPIHVTGVESGSLDFFVSLDMEGAKALAYLATFSLGLVMAARRFSATRESVKDAKYSPRVLEEMKKEEDGHLARERDVATKQLLDNAHSSVEPTRKNELAKQVDVSITIMVKSYERGVRVDILLPPETPKAEGGISSAAASFSEIKGLAERVHDDSLRLLRGEIEQKELAGAGNEDRRVDGTGKAGGMTTS